MDEFPQQASARGAAPNSAAYPNGEQPKRAHLYVGGISPRVTEYMLQEIFGVAGPVIGVKIIPDRNFQHGGANYGFVEFQELRSAETALQTLNGRKIFDNEIKVMWAYQNQASAPKEDLAGHYHVFCGDLSPEVTDEVLRKAFAAFGSLSDARCMWDMNTGKSRGYGFLAFRDKTDAEQAIATMNGEWLGTKAIRVNWANSKNGHIFIQGQPGAPSASPMGTTHAATSAPASYDQIVSQAPSFNSTIYVGNLVPFVSQADLIPLFQGFGYIVEIRMQADRGFAFVKLDTHENAANAIINLTGTNVHGRPLKCSWGKDKEAGSAFGGSTGSASPAHIVGSPQPYQQQQQQQARPQPGLVAQQPPYMYAQQPYAQAQQPYGTYSAQPQPQQQQQQPHQHQQQAPQDPAAAAAAMAAWQAQYGAQYAAYMQQQAALQHQHYQAQQQHGHQPPHYQGGRPQ
ncbi:BQ5605_C007g04576 [Microbotryum silenes-dioicae]|uniref:BQ5605_C007g04576 protein n=1 Tax=Microbotryum silenes-dioicae TaxID=796604 RepID=A0A2X0MAE1_9BASI|nr:BQ5605_C007g04576 [Microbotryum silenes-dioicae]